MAATLLTARQVGDLLEVDATTVYRMAGDGRLPAVRIGRQWRFPAEAIDQLLSPGRPAGPVPDGSPSGTAVPPHLAQALLETVAPPLGVSMVVTDLAGRPITPVVNPPQQFVRRFAEPAFVAECVEDWASFAAEPHLAPRFQTNRFGFLCAHSWVRHGASLVAMVLAGGVSPDGVVDDGLYALDVDARALVLETLPRVGALLSRFVADPAAALSTA